MTVAITTPTGHVGSHVLRDLIRAGIRPRVLLREPSALPDELLPLVDAERVDQFDAASVVAATQGVTTLFWVVPPSALDDPLDGYRHASAAVSAAVRESGVERVVLLSSGGAERRHGLGEIDGLGMVEQALDDSGAAVVHLRCGYFFSNLLMDAASLADGTLTTAMGPDLPLPWVAPRDIAAVATGWLLRSNWTGRHVQGVHGPRDLTPREVVGVLSEALGRDVELAVISDDALREQLLAAGMTPAQVEAMVGMVAGTRDGGAAAEPRDPTTTTPTTLDAWAWSELRPAVVAAGTAG